MNAHELQNKEKIKHIKKATKADISYITATRSAAHGMEADRIPEA